MSGFLNRLSLGVRFALGGYKAVANLIPTWSEGQAAYSSTDFPTMVRSGFRKNELIFACVSKSANSASQVRAIVRRRRDKKILEDHPLRALIQKPNPFMSEFDFWSSIIIFQKLAGRAYFEKERSNGGQVVRLWPLRPDWVSPMPSSQTMIGAYEYRVPGMEPKTLKVEDVLDFKLFDPLDRYGAYPPVAVAARVGDVDNSATDFLKLFFDKGGIPPGLLKTKQKLVDAQVTDIRRRWRERYGGADKWMEPAVLDSDAEYQKTGLTFEEMGFEVLDARNEARICMVLDVPPILVGANVGLARATYSNYREARKAWWEDSLSPMYVNFQDVVENGLVSEFGDDITCGWDFSMVAAFQEETNERWRRATSALTAGGITVNEFCAEVGLPDKGPAGNVYLRNPGISEIPAGTSAKCQHCGTVQEAEGGSCQKCGAPLPQQGMPHQHFSKVSIAQNAPDDTDRRRYEAKLSKAMMEYFEAQKERLISAVSD